MWFGGFSECIGLLWCYIKLETIGVLGSHKLSINKFVRVDWVYKVVGKVRFNLQRLRIVKEERVGRFIERRSGKIIAIESWIAWIKW